MDCPSCGATGQQKARCEACGFAFPQAGDGDGDVLSLFLGLVCASCDGYNDPGTTTCLTCGAPLEVPWEPEAPAPSAPLPLPAAPAAPLPSAPPRESLSAPAASAPPSWMTPPTGQPLSSHQATPKVDLAVMGGAAPIGLAAPSPTPLPTRSTLPPPASLSTSSPPAPALSSPPVAVDRTCWRCQAALETADKFCRDCGARVDAAPAPTSSPSVAGPLGVGGLGTVGAVGSAAAATQAIAALKIASPPTAAPTGSSSTMVIPAMRAAASAPVPQPSSTATMVFGAVTVERVAKLILVRGHTQYGSQWRLQASETLIGRSEGMILFPEDTAIGPRHARLTWRGQDLVLEPLPTTNGVYVRLRAPVRLQPGDEFLVGAQRLRVLGDDDRLPVLPRLRDETPLLGSVVKDTPPISLARIGGEPGAVEVYHRPQRLLTIGRAHCDILYPTDGFVSERHAQLTSEGGSLTLEDLGSRNGTYVRARTPTVLQHGDLLLLGDQVLRVELPNRA